jgi:hypothetical protein
VGPGQRPACCCRRMVMKARVRNTLPLELSASPPLARR